MVTAAFAHYVDSSYDSLYRVYTNRENTVINAIPLDNGEAVAPRTRNGVALWLPTDRTLGEHIILNGTYNADPQVGPGPCCLLLLSSAEHL